MAPLNTQDHGKRASQSNSQTAKKQKKPSAIPEDDELGTSGESQDSTTTNSSYRHTSLQPSRSPESADPVDVNAVNEAPQREETDRDIIEREEQSRAESSTPISAHSSANPRISSRAQAKSSSTNVSVSPTSYVQTVLDTSGAIWNRKSGFNGGCEPPRKKRRSEPTGDSGGSEDGRDNGEMQQDNQNMQDILLDEETAVHGQRKEAEHVENNAVVEARNMVDIEMEDAGEDQLEEASHTTPQKQDRQIRITTKRGLRPGPRDLRDSEPQSMEIDDLVEDTVIDSDLSRQRVLVNRNGRQQHQATSATEVVDLTDPPPDETEAHHAADSEVTVSTYEDFVSRKEVVKAATVADRTLRFDLSRVSSLWRRLSDQAAPRGATNSAESVAIRGDKETSSVPLVFSADEDDKAAEATLSRVIDKSDFGIMDIVGQFNRGFIVTRRKQADMATDTCGKAMDDLFIIDQHAADEKYNFETLQQTTKINSQRLLK